MEKEYYLGDAICLPTAVEYAMRQNPDLGVCVVFKHNNFHRWLDFQFNNSAFSQRRITSIVLNGRVSDFEEKFLIVDKNGKLCASNCNAVVTVNKQGIICINGREYFIKPIEDGKSPQFVCGRNIDELNAKLNVLIKAKTIKPPVGFGKTGYSTNSGQMSEPKLN